MRHYFILLFLSVSIYAQDQIQRIIEKNFVDIQYTTIRYSSLYPWVAEYGNEYKQYGIIIHPQLVLTQCDDLPNAIDIFIKTQQNRKVKASVDLMDIEVNLCILRLESKILEHFISWDDLPIGEDPSLKQKIDLGFYNDFRNFEKKTFIVSEYIISSDFGFTKLPVFIFTNQKALKIFTPIFSENKIVGFVSYFSENKIFSIPISRIDFFIKSFLNHSYEGFVVQGIQLEELDYEDENPISMYYNIVQNACLVKNVLPNTSYYSYIKKGDILLSIENLKPIKKCMYSDPKLGIQKFELLLTRTVTGNYRKNQEEVFVEILRDGQKFNIKIPLYSVIGDQNYFERIPWKIYGKQPYIVFFGVVFVELSRNFLLERFGKDWKSKAIELSYLYDTKKNYQTLEERDKIIIVSDVLPNPINIGYRDIRLKPIKTVNKKSVKDLKELLFLIEQSKKENQSFLEVEFSDGKKIFFNFAKESEHKKILDQFNVAEWYYIKN